MLCLSFTGAAHRALLLTAGICLGLLLRVAEPGYADEPPPPTSPLEVRVSPTSPTGVLEPGAVGIDHDGRFAVTWQQGHQICNGNQSDMLISYHHADGSGLEINALPLSGPQNPFTQINHQQPSISMSLNSHIRVAWLADNGDAQPATWPILVQQDFAWGDDPTDVLVPVGTEFYGIRHDPPSAGMANSGAARAAWTHHHCPWGEESDGLVQGLNRDDFDLVRPCGCDGSSEGFCRINWNPCMAMRPTDGYFCVAYAYDETPTEEFSPFNVALRVYDPNGVVVAQREGDPNDPNDPEHWVNDPSLEPAGSSQTSPAVSIHQRRHCRRLVRAADRP